MNGTKAFVWQIFVSIGVNRWVVGWPVWRWGRHRDRSRADLSGPDFSQHQATGTSLAVLLPPIGLGATLEYYRHGNVNVHAAIILAITMFVGSWLGAFGANKIAGPYLRLVFGAFVWGMGSYLIYGASRRLGWL